MRYPGGKSRGVTFLARHIPAFKELREVFFGGGSLSFHYLQHTGNQLFKASDLNYELWCFWSQLQTNTQLLINGVQEVYDTCKSAGTSGGKTLFAEILDRRNNSLSELQRAIDFYVLNRITFSGVVDSGGFSQASFDGRFTQSSIDRLAATAPVIKPVQFFCEDFTYLINQPGADVFLFLDPPYYAATKSKLYGKNGILHTEFDHRLLADSLKESPHKWLITYDNSPYIRDLYKGFAQLPWRLQYGMTNSTSAAGNELLIANYDLSVSK